MLNSPVQALRASWRVREKKEGSEILNQRCIALPLVESLSQSGNPTLRSDERKSSKMWDSVWFRALEEGKGQNRHPCSGVARNTRCSPELSSSCASRRGVGWLMCGERREKKRWRGGGSERERVREGRGGHSAGARMSDTDNKSTQTFNARFHWACPDHAVQAIEREGGGGDLLFFSHNHSSCLFLCLICRNRHLIPNTTTIWHSDCHEWTWAGSTGDSPPCAQVCCFKP